MRVFLILTFLAIHSYLFAQLGGPCPVMAPQDSTAWGIGAIKWETDIYVRGQDKQNRTFYVGQSTVTVDNIKSPIVYGDVVFARHYGNAFLKVFEIRNTLYKVLVNTVEGGVWIEFDELNSKNLRFNTYSSILFNDNPNGVGAWRITAGSLGVNLFKSCLNLRTKASVDSKIIRCLNKNVSDSKFHAIDIEYHHETWAFIVVREFGLDSSVTEEGCPYKVLSEIRGWAKVIDDNGYPNLWFSVTNY